MEWNGLDYWTGTIIRSKLSSPVLDTCPLQTFTQSTDEGLGERLSWLIRYLPSSPLSAVSSGQGLGFQLGKIMSQKSSCSTSDKVLLRASSVACPSYISIKGNSSRPHQRWSRQGKNRLFYSILFNAHTARKLRRPLALPSRHVPVLTRYIPSLARAECLFVLGNSNVHMPCLPGMSFSVGTLCTY